MAESKRNFHVYRGYFEKWEDEIQKNNKIEPLYYNGINIQTPKKKGNHIVPPLLPSHIKANTDQSFQGIDAKAKIKLIKVPGIRSGKIVPTLESIAKTISEKLLSYSEHYPPQVGSALELLSVSENGIFTYSEFYMGAKSEKWGSWVQDDQSIKIILNGKQIN